MKSFQSPLPYIAVIKSVKEISLTGWASLAFWRERLADEALTPVDFDGRAQLLISSIEGRFMGLKFHELIVAVSVEAPAYAAPQQGVFLVHAFNSSRLLGWCERTMFATPYYYGQIENSVTSPAFMAVQEAGETKLRAELVASTPQRQGHAGWAGPIFLPSSPKTKPEQRQVFFADLQGETAAYPFLSERDKLTIQRSSRWPVFEWLQTSQFSPQEWSLRQNATHSRTKTIRRQAVAGQVTTE